MPRCCFYDYDHALPIRPARTREEMVEATMVAMYGGQTFEYRDDGKEPVRRAHALYRAERVLIAAGVIEEAPTDV